jgi:hypothetical protein
VIALDPELPGEDRRQHGRSAPVGGHRHHRLVYEAGVVERASRVDQRRDSGAKLAITVRGRQALPIELRAVAREPLPESSVQDVVCRLPPWTTTTTTTFRLRRLEL